ncbi:SHOCT domain-containing protein [Streptomyces gobiensis]|uniref:SHOCT domain-containing protein n=1 Tax=Streptomyces gobiensis TaxID=2875706 RepID=UPI001E31A884|nr:hypothetical protein [Streptomyces gobiensis]UGY91008.1 hypothetical protein test1122_04215 [Streptomyces gobiensis]
MMGMMGPGMMILWLIITMVVLGLGVGGAVWLARSLTDRSRPPELPAQPDSAQQELRQQYAAGNIDREEYLQRKIDLEP